jgi:D-glycero-alpha-D-manno-heptose-7-phosphate kinase
MSFFGGGTDLPEFFFEHGGSVLSTTFDKYCYVTVRHLPQFFAYRNEAVYSKIEQVGSPDEFEHPVVRESMKLMDMHDLRISYEADLPARSGLGTSSSFTVGLINAFYAIKGKTVGKEQLALDAIHVERDLCQEAGGWQDQVAAAFGGFNRIDFDLDGFRVAPVRADSSTITCLNRHLMLFFTGIGRFSAAAQQTLQTAIPKRTRQLLKMRSLVDEAEKVLQGDRPLDDFGHLLNESWRIKRSLTDAVTNDTIDDVYDSAIGAGALGGKLLGSGAGGFLLFYVDEDRQAAVRHALSSLMEVPFQFEDSGASTLYRVPETYTKTSE